MIRRGVMIIGVLGIGLAPGARAEVLTLQSAVQLAYERNPTVQAAREKIREMEAHASTSYSYLFPNVGLVGTGTYRKDSATNPLALFGAEPYNNYFVGFTLNQPIWMSGAISGQIGVSKANEEIAERDYLIARRDVGLNVIQAFLALLVAEHQVAILEANQKIDEDLVKTISGFQRLGRAQLLDVLQIKTQLALLVPKVAQARSRVKTAAIELATLLGAGDTPDIEIKGTLETPDRKKVESYFSKESPRLYELERANQVLEQVDSQRSLTLAKEYPSLALVGNWGRNAYVKTDLFDSGATTWALALQFNVPIFSGLSSIYERRATASQQKQAEIAKANAENQMTLTQVEAQKQVDLAQEVLTGSEDAFTISQKALTEAKSQLHLGRTSIVQYLQSEQSSLDAQLAFEQAKSDYWVSLLRYGALRGYDPQKLLEVL